MLTTLLLLVFLVQSIALGATTSYCPNTNACYTVTPSSDGAQLTIAITGAQGKYTALGWGGSGMTDSDIVIAWYSSSTPVVSNRFSSGYVMPTADATPQDATIVTSGCQEFSNNTWVITFIKNATAVRSATDRDWPTSSSAQFIWAIGTAPSSTTQSATVSEHSQKGTFSASRLLSTTVTATPSPAVTTSSDTASSSSGVCVSTSNPRICFSATMASSTTAQITFTVSDSSIWVGLGIGSQMAGSDMMIAWLAPSGSSSTFVLSDRYGSGHTTPSASENQNLTLNSTASSSTSSGWTIVFTRPLAASDSTYDLALVNGTASYIWAYGTKPSSASSSASFSQHTDFGVISANLFTSTSSSATSESATKNIAHAILMFIAWGVLTPLAIAVARFFHNAGAWWFQVHRAFFIVAIIITVIAFALAVSRFSDLGATHFDDAHGVIGLIVFIVSIFQSVLGFIIDKAYDPNRSSVPWWDKLHWWAGRICFLLAIVAMSIAVTWYSPLTTDNPGYVSIGAAIAYWVWICVVVVAFIIYGIYFQRSPASKSPTHPNVELDPK